MFNIHTFILGICSLFLFSHAAAQPFTADFSALSECRTSYQEQYEKFPTPPYLTVYTKGNKKLVLLAARHGAESLPSVQYAFDVYAPQVALVEREPAEAFGGPCTEAEDSYTAALCGKQQIPLVRADLSQEKQWQFAKENGILWCLIGTSIRKGRRHAAKFYLILWCLIGTARPSWCYFQFKFYLILWCLIGTFLLSSAVGCINSTLFFDA